MPGPARCVVLLVWTAAGCGRVGFDPRPDATTPSCPSFAILCDDFETGDLSKWTGTVAAMDAAVAVTGNRAHSGTAALESKVPQAATSGGQASAWLDLGTGATRMIAVREWINAPEPVTDFDGVILVIDRTTNKYELAAVDTAGTWVVGESDGTSIDDHHGTAPGPALDTWTCVELDITLPPNTPHIELLVDEVAVVSADIVDPSPAYSEARVGVTNAAIAGDHVFVDDVVIANQPIGCL